MTTAADLHRAAEDLRTKIADHVTRDARNQADRFAALDESAAYQIARGLENLLAADEDEPTGEEPKPEPKPEPTGEEPKPKPKPKPSGRSAHGQRIREAWRQHLAEQAEQADQSGDDES